MIFILPNYHKDQTVDPQAASLARGCPVRTSISCLLLSAPLPDLPEKVGVSWEPVMHPPPMEAA